jgi:methyltransferase family protein
LTHWEHRFASDEEWLEAHCAPADHGLPRLPAEADQLHFTALSGPSNLRQAFAFYTFCRDRVGALRAGDQVLDFGCGWGRIARFWLRDVAPERLWCLDVSERALGLLRETGLRARVVRHDVLPPVTELAGQRFRVIAAYSVFSHLPEEAARRWLAFLGGHLAFDGTLVLTTRGRRFIERLRSLEREPPTDDSLRRLLRAASPVTATARAHEAGRFVFIDTEVGQHYGEALIPEEYARRHVPDGLELTCFLDVGGPEIDQAILVFEARDRDRGRARSDAGRGNEQPAATSVVQPR